MQKLHMLHSLDCEVGQRGSTVRNGLKWADVQGQQIELCVCAHRQTDIYTCPQEDVQGLATVENIWVGKMCDVPAKLIETEHEIRSRQYSGLLDSMRKAYGDAFSEDNQVVVLTYLRER